MSGCPTKGHYSAKITKNAFLPLKWTFVGQSDNHIGWATSLAYTCVPSTKPRTISWNFGEKMSRIGGFEKLTFFDIQVLENETLIFYQKILNHLVFTSCRFNEIPGQGHYRKDHRGDRWENGSTSQNIQGQFTKQIQQANSLDLVIHISNQSWEDTGDPHLTQISGLGKNCVMGNSC